MSKRPSDENVVASKAAKNEELNDSDSEEEVLSDSESEEAVDELQSDEEEEYERLFEENRSLKLVYSRLKLLGGLISEINSNVVVNKFDDLPQEFFFDDTSLFKLDYELIDWSQIPEDEIENFLETHEMRQEKFERNLRTKLYRAYKTSEVEEYFEQLAPQVLMAINSILHNPQFSEAVKDAKVIFNHMDVRRLSEIKVFAQNCGDELLIRAFDTDLSRIIDQESESEYNEEELSEDELGELIEEQNGRVENARTRILTFMKLFHKYLELSKTPKMDCRLYDGNRTLLEFQVFNDEQLHTNAIKKIIETNFRSDEENFYQKLADETLKLFNHGKEYAATSRTFRQAFSIVRKDLIDYATDLNDEDLIKVLAEIQEINLQKTTGKKTLDNSTVSGVSIAANPLLSNAASQSKSPTNC